MGERKTHEIGFWSSIDDFDMYEMEIVMVGTFFEDFE